MKFILFNVLLIFLLHPLTVTAQQCAEILIVNLNQSRRAELLVEYRDKDFRSVEQNQEWINAHKESREGLYIELTASELKNLNDNIIGNFDLVTALINLKKEMEIEALEAFHASMGRTFDPEAIIYSDFKTVRYFIPMNAEQKRMYAPLLVRTFTEIDSRYKRRLLDEGFVRRSDLSTQWFNMGVAATSDLASAGARKASDLGVYALNMMESHAQSLLAKDLAEAKDLYKILSQNRFYDYLFQEDKVFKLKVVELYKKNRTPESFASAITSFYPYELDISTARMFVRLFELIDVFSPSLVIADRTKVSVENLKNGAFSLDFMGLGAKNLIATAMGVISSNNIGEAFRKIRINEETVTEEFERQKDLVRAIAQQFFDYNNNQDAFISFSGDEGIVVPDREMHLKDVLDFQQALLQAFGLSQLRVVYKRADNEGTIDTEMVSVGETIEERLQFLLGQRIDPKILNLTQFNIWVFEPRRLGESRKLELTLFSSQPHSEAQREFIRETFKRVVRALNRENDNISIRPANEIRARFIQ